MNARLKSLIDEAETDLDAGHQARLADMLEAFLTMYRSQDAFTPEELAHLAMIDAEPYEPADPDTVVALFNKRG